MAKKRRRKAPPGVDPNEKRRERLEARRRAKAEALAAQHRARQRERIVRYAVFAAILGGVVWVLFLRGGLPAEIEGHEIETFSLAGANQHSESPAQYETNPPVSGTHFQAQPSCGIFPQDIPDGNEVHALEHGGVGLLYQPSLDTDEIQQLEDRVTASDSHVFSAPDDDMDTPVAITAWGHMMTLDTVDESAIDEFIEVFAQNGDAPEAFNDCPNSGNQSFIDAISTPTPETTEPPKDGGGKKERSGDEGGSEENGGKKKDGKGQD